MLIRIAVLFLVRRILLLRMGMLMLGLVGRVVRLWHIIELVRTERWLRRVGRLLAGVVLLGGRIVVML